MSEHTYPFKGHKEAAIGDGMESVECASVTPTHHMSGGGAHTVLDDKLAQPCYHTLHYVLLTATVSNTST